jgi:hypothetical protein
MIEASCDSPGQVDVEEAREAILRYQTGRNWVAQVDDPSPRSEIGFGFDLNRSDASAMLSQIGLDREAVLRGRVPISDEQMSELFDLTLAKAVEWGERRIPGFRELGAERQSALLEIIVWLGPDGCEKTFDLLERLPVPTACDPPRPSPWFDDPGAIGTAGVPGLARTIHGSPDPELRAWTRSISLLYGRARKRYEFESDASFARLPHQVQAILADVQHRSGDRADRFWSAAADRRWMDAQLALRALAPSDKPQARFTEQADVLKRLVQDGELQDRRAERRHASDPRLHLTRQETDPSEHSMRIGAFRTVFESFGVVAELRADDPGLLASALAILPPGWRPVAEEPNVQFVVHTDGLIMMDGGYTARVRDRDACLLKLGTLVHHRVACEAPAHTFARAGVVAVDDCGIVIPGGPYTGTSTLVEELVRLGATYFSDEYAVVDLDGFVHPFGNPLSIREGRHGGLGQARVVAASQPSIHPIRAHLVVLTWYTRGAEWRPTVRTRAEGACALLENTVTARSRPGSALMAARRVVDTALVLAGERGEARTAAEAVLETAAAAGYTVDRSAA